MTRLVTVECEACGKRIQIARSGEAEHFGCKRRVLGKQAPRYRKVVHA